MLLAEYMSDDEFSNFLVGGLRIFPLSLPQRVQNDQKPNQDVFPTFYVTETRKLCVAMLNPATHGHMFSNLLPFRLWHRGWPRRSKGSSTPVRWDLVHRILDRGRINLCSRWYPFHFDTRQLSTFEIRYLSLQTCNQ